ncbi:hypothetical protein ACNKHN_02625 [Shigella flexneri]
MNRSAAPAQYGISLAEVKSVLDASNQEAGGSSIELAEAEYMVRASGASCNARRL